MNVKHSGDNHQMTMTIIPTSSLITMQNFAYCFRLDALAKALSVIDIQRRGWVAESHSGIVSKPLNLSENFFDHLKASSF